MKMKSLLSLPALGGAGLLCLAGPRSVVAADYNPIMPTMADRTVTLTGHDLTVEQVLEVARYGARVALSDAARRRQADTWGLMMEGATEGVPIYLFNRNPGAGREQVRFTGDPLSPVNRPTLRNMQVLGPAVLSHSAGNPGDYDAEIRDEDVARAIMVVRANQMTFLPASPPIMQGLINLLNADITPVMRARGGTGEAESPIAAEITAAIGGEGDVYYHGVRMSALDALHRAGLSPTPTDAGDGTTTTVNADVAGRAALVVADARRFLEWADLVYAMDLDGMNSSVTSLFGPVQANRPYPWINFDAARVLDMLHGSYLFENDARRIIQDPESLRASYVRQGSAWEEWANLRDDVTIQMNGSDHNPAVAVNASPQDGWELSTPWAMRYYVHGGRESHGQHGFIFSNANWDPYPLGNRLEAFTIALANTDVAIMLRQERFRSTFFTLVRAEDVLGPRGASGGVRGVAWSNHEVWQRIQGLINPVPPEGYSGDAQGVEELDAETNIKVERSERALRESWLLLASDMVVASRWLDVRRTQVPDRPLGAAPTAAWQAFRRIAPLPGASQRADRAMVGEDVAALQFLQDTPAARFYPGGPPMPPSHW